MDTKPVGSRPAIMLSGWWRLVWIAFAVVSLGTAWYDFRPHRQIFWEDLLRVALSSYLAVSGWRRGRKRGRFDKGAA